MCSGIFVGEFVCAFAGVLHIGHEATVQDIYRKQDVPEAHQTLVTGQPSAIVASGAMLSAESYFMFPRAGR